MKDIYSPWCFFITADTLQAHHLFTCQLSVAAVHASLPLKVSDLILQHAMQVLLLCDCATNTRTCNNYLPVWALSDSNAAAAWPFLQNAANAYSVAAAAAAIAARRCQQVPHFFVVYLQKLSPHYKTPVVACFLYHIKQLPAVEQCGPRQQSLEPG
jgi:hypothetical protein